MSRKPKCDCLNWCGDDSRLHEGTVRPCETMRRKMDRLVRGTKEINLKSQDVIEHAVKTLELDPAAEYEITFMAHTEIDMLRDPDEIMDGVDWDLAPDEQGFYAAIEAGVQQVKLPAGFRVVGMTKKVTPAVKRVFGVVDFSSMGAE